MSASGLYAPRWHDAPRVGRLGLLAASRHPCSGLCPLGSELCMVGPSVKTGWGRASSEEGIEPTTSVSFLTLCSVTESCSAMSWRPRLRQRRLQRQLCLRLTGAQSGDESRTEVNVVLSLQREGPAFLAETLGESHEFIKVKVRRWRERRAVKGVVCLLPRAV